MKLRVFDDLVLLAVVADCIHALNDPIDTTISCSLNEPEWNIERGFHLKINSSKKKSQNLII